MAYNYPCINVNDKLDANSKIGVFLTDTPEADTVIATATDASYLVPGVFDIDNDGFYAAVQGKQVVLAVGTAPATPDIHLLVAQPKPAHLWICGIRLPLVEARLSCCRM